ncbi:uncharacterized protein LOC111709978 isoform X2 [Eurytemora carolleeae]|uniref:uncharacterized protein LOC111709978 isoform X2 n=1 Tax=Eurytemora carolleeae TaxID=1294199 RepID=UPI000C756D92|nr:uncharacterized protein LOC111709978 isoform X2 [Eurytemora carolleeae]|eukprot:XP_023339730.1 uncharacterized protein LOC111709978 isoform X2 [Eurytemora affinis]
MGDNTNNRLFLDLDKPVEKSYQFKPVLDHVGDIKQIAISKYCTLVLTGSGEIWSIGEDNSRAPTRINLDSKISQVMGLGATKQLHILVGQDGAVVRWTPGRWKERDAIVIFKLSSGNVDPW